MRLPIKYLGYVRKAFKDLEDEVEEVQTKSSEMITYCNLAFLRREIELLHGLNKPFCEGCKVQHPSQNEHMGSEGCLSDEPPCWEKQVDYFFVEAMEAVKREDCEKLAEKVSEKLALPLVKPMIKQETADAKKLSVIDSIRWVDEIYLMP